MTNRIYSTGASLNIVTNAFHTIQSKCFVISWYNSTSLTEVTYMLLIFLHILYVVATSLGKDAGEKNLPKINESPGSH